MRDIKFRGQRVDNKEWVHGYYTVISGTHYISNEPYGEMYFDHQVIPETVGQYTGLKDKNGKEIYEDDIITYNFLTKNSNDQFTSKVFFDEYMWLTDEHSLNRINNVEIIGNIHETPHLIEQQEQKLKQP